jgi:hypothetical protein
VIRIQRNVIGFNRDRSALLLNGAGSSGRRHGQPRAPVATRQRLAHPRA